VRRRVGHGLTRGLPAGWQTKNAAAVSAAAAVASGKLLKQTMEDNAHENRVLSGKARADPNSSDLFDDTSKRQGRKE
jgi:hypothetical protein